MRNFREEFEALSRTPDVPAIDQHRTRMRNIQQQNNEVTNPIAQVGNYARRQAGSLVSGFARAATDIPQDLNTLQALGRAGFDSITGRSDAGFLPGVMRYRYGDEGQAKLMDFEKQAMTSFFQENPDVKDQDDPKFQEWYHNFVRSDDYLAEERAILGDWWAGGSEQIGDFLDDVIGAPRDIDKNPIEFGMSAFGAQLNPLGRVFRAATNFVSGGNRGVALAADFVLPGSQSGTLRDNLIVGNVSGAVSTGIAATIEWAIQDPITATNIINSELGPDDDPSEIAELAADFFKNNFDATAAINILTGLRLALGLNKGVAPGNTVKPFEDGGAGGPTKPPESQRATNPVRTALGENRPLATELAEMGAQNADDIVKDLSYLSNAAIGHHLSNLEFRGMLPDGTETIPLRQLSEAQELLAAAGKWDTYAAVRRAETQLDTRDALINRHIDAIRAAEDAVIDAQVRIQALNNKLTAAQTATERNKIRNQLTRTADELATKDTQLKSLQNDPDYLARLGDTPESRQALEGKSYKDLTNFVAQHRNDPDFIRVKQMEQNAYTALNKMEKYKFTAQELAQRAQDNPRYMPQKHATHAGEDGMKGPVERAISVVKDRLSFDQDLYGNRYADNAQLGKPVSRQADNKPGTKVNMPGDPLEAMRLRMYSAVRQYMHNQARMTYIQAIKAAAKKSGQTPRYRVIQTKHGEQWLTKKQITALQARGFNLDNYIPVWKDGRAAFYKFNDPDVHARLKHMPHTSVPFLRSFAASWRLGTTGALNPSFAPISALYEQVIANITRKRGTTLGLDAGVDRLLRALGASQDGPVRTIGRNVSRVAASPLDPFGFALQLDSALRLTVRQMQEYWTARTMRDLVNSSGFIGQLAKDPKTRAALEKMAQSSLHSLKDSFYYELTNAGAVNSEATRTLLRRLENYEKTLDMTQWQTTAQLKRGTEHMLNPMNEGLNFVRFVVQGIKDSTKYSYAMRQRSLLLERTGGQTNTAAYKKGIEDIIRDTRTLSGDFMEKPGSKALQKLDSAAPFTNVMFVSMRHLAMSAKRDPSMFAQTFGTLVLGRVYAEYMMSNWDQDAYDFWHRQTPWWQRATAIPMPTIQTLAAWAQGQRVPFTRDAIFMATLPNEVRPFIEAPAQFIRSLGLYGAGQNEQLATNDFSRPFREALGQAFVPVVPPALSALVAPFGITLDPASAITGRNPFGSAAPGSEQEPIHQDSIVTRSVMDLIGAIGGVFGRNAIEAFDTATNVASEDGLLEGIRAGGQELAERMFKTDRETPLAMFGLRGQTRIYRGNPLSENSAAMRRAFTLSSNASPEARRIPAQTGDPLVDMMRPMLARYARRDPQIRRFSAQHQQIAEKIDNVNSNRSVPYNERIQLINELNQERFEFDKAQASYLQAMEQTLGNIVLPQGVTYGQAFEQRFGKPWGFKNFGLILEGYRGRRGG
jgi:hypothetical protein